MREAYPLAQNATHAQEAEKLFEVQRRSHNPVDWMRFNEHLDRFGTWAETKKTIAPLDLENGRDFITDFHFSDGSIWESSEIYFTDKDGQIAFERRGDALNSAGILTKNGGRFSLKQN